MIGVHDQQATLNLPAARFYDLGGSLRVAWYGDCLPTRDIPLLSTWYAQGRLDLDGVVTRLFSLDESEAAFHAMERGETLRGVIRL
jgi:S-(hydroxymethyl)mycothiol dehydrogenase